jgi:prevent-host-death family protein
MAVVSVLDAENQFAELARRVEGGETVTVTRDGEPILDLVPRKPHKPGKGINWEALAAYKKKHGIDKFFPFIPDDFDDPLPEDFLLQPLPPEK